MTRYFITVPDLPVALWSLPPRRFRALMLATDHRTAERTYQERLAELALWLVLQAPAGAPAGPEEFLDRLNAADLAAAWGGVLDETVPWAGHPGMDRMIAEVAAGKYPALSMLLAECHNTFRLWSEDPHTLLRAAAEVGIGTELVRGL